MDTGYYSVQSILAESQTLQTKFTRRCPGVGYLDPENEDGQARHHHGDFLLLSTRY